MLVTLRGKVRLGEVEIGRGSSDATCPAVALQTWLKLARIAHGPLFRRVTGQGKTVGAERLNDQEVARLVKRAALAAGVRGDLSEGDRATKFSAIPCALAWPRRPRPMCKNSLPRQRRNVPALSAPKRSFPRQSHQGEWPVVAGQ